MSDVETRKKRQPRVPLAIFLVAVGILILWSGISGLLDDRRAVFVPRGRIMAEFVETPELQAKGLSGRESLGRNDGMMFVYSDESVDRCFWMKDTNFSLDMIWLNAEKRVVYIKENVTPETYPESFCPDEPAQYVLEINAGRAEDLGINDGVEVRF